MPVILVANPKGGVGKSTLSTNLAGYFARQGVATMLGDTDKQQSSRTWLHLRADTLPKIQTWGTENDGVVRPPKGVSHIVLDTPAGLGDDQLKDLLKITNKLIVPLQPSMFDILATQHFLEDLAKRKPVRDGQVSVGVIGMRVDARTRAADQLQRFVETLGLPVLGYLRDTQNYVQLAAHGLTLWDVAPSRVEKDLAQWETLLAWVAKQ